MFGRLGCTQSLNNQDILQTNLHTNMPHASEVLLINKHILCGIG